MKTNRTLAALLACALLPAAALAQTANLGMVKPIVGADDDAWGTKINAALDAIDGVFNPGGDGTSVGLKVGAGKTLDATNGTVDLTDAHLFIQDNADPTKIAKFQLSGFTTATTHTFALPDLDDTLAGVSATQTLSNKTLVAPVLGAASATSLNKLTLTQPASGATLTLADGSTLATSGAHAITLTASADSNVTLPAAGTLAALGGTNSWPATQTFTVAPVFSDQSGTRTALGLGTAATASTGTSGAVVPLLNAANTFSADQTLQSTDPGAGLAPNLIIDRNSASPAAADLLGSILFRGRDSTNAATSYAEIRANLVDPTDTSEDGRLEFRTMIAGNSNPQWYVGAGLYASSQADQGIGTVNATGLYLSGVNLLTGAHSWAGTQTFTLAPVFTDQSGSRTALGLATVASSGSAADLGSGTLPAGRLPNPTAITLGGVESIAAVPHQFLTTISTGGAPSLAQPAAGDVSGLVASATTDTTNAANISSGTLAAARLPNPSATTLGGVQSAAAVAHQFITSISTSGVPALAQPAASDVSGLAASATTDTTNASNIATGTLAANRGGAGLITGALKGNGAGAVFQAGCADLSNGATGCSTIVGTAATVNTGTSGATIPLLNGTNTWAAAQTFTTAPVFTDASTTRTNIGLPIGTSGATVPLNNANNTTSGSNVHSGTETFQAGVAVTGGMINIGSVANLTIATGMITVTKSYVSVETEAGALTDDLDTINGGTQGDIIFVKATTTGHTVVLKNGTGNLQLAGDCSLAKVQSRIVLMFQGSSWFEISRSLN